MTCLKHKTGAFSVWKDLSCVANGQQTRAGPSETCDILTMHKMAHRQARSRFIQTADMPFIAGSGRLSRARNGPLGLVSQAKSTGLFFLGGGGVIGPLFLLRPAPAKTAPRLDERPLLPPVRIELTTPCLRDRCSAPELRRLCGGDHMFYVGRNMGLAILLC